MITRYLFVIILAVAVTSSCQSDGGRQNTAQSPVPGPTEKASATPAPTVEGTPEDSAGRTATAACQEVKTGDNVIYKKQTFAIDFEPFKGSCFVTAHNPEYDNPPLESQFAIYKNNKRTFEFPSQFNGSTFGCWVDAVAFQDLNGDKMTDIIVIGKCMAKVESYNENMVYINDGKGFTTREDANNQLGEMTSIKAVIAFVEENRTMFF
jgi:hypothetical protein